MHLVRWRRGLGLCKCRRSTAPPNYGSVPMIIIIMPNEHVSLFAQQIFMISSSIRFSRKTTTSINAVLFAVVLQRQAFQSTTISFIGFHSVFIMKQFLGVFTLVMFRARSALSGRQHRHWCSLLIFHLHFWQRAHVARRILCSTNTSQKHYAKSNKPLLFYILSLLHVL